MIDEGMVEEAVDYLRDSAINAANATADRVYLTEYRKTKKAMLRADYRVSHHKATEGQCDDYAYSHPDYIEVLNGLREATALETKLRFLREAAEAKISAYQTQCKMSLGIKM